MVSWAERIGPHWHVWVYVCRTCHDICLCMTSSLHCAISLFNSLPIQHNVPWPAFLQARFNIPSDGRSLKELIAYDCRWRGREPCTCLPDSGPLPPCVEFPWFYTDPSATSTAVTSTSPQLSPNSAHPPTEVSTSSVSSLTTANVTDVKTGDGTRNHSFGIFL